MIVVEISYAQIKALRSNLNARIYCQDRGFDYLLHMQDGAVVSECRVPKKLDDASDNPDAIDVADNLLPHANAVIEREEVRFQTHDYSNKATWSGETTGYPAAWFAGGVTRHPISGLYVDAMGASMLAAYATPGDPHYGDPTYLFGSMAYQIEDRYDDVDYKWYDKPLSDPTKTELCYLDQSALNHADHVWRRTDTNEVIVKYVHPVVDTSKPDHQQEYRDGQWFSQDGNGDWTVDRTCSIWRLRPYDGYKVEIHEAWLSCDVEAVLNGALHYRAYSHVEAGDPQLPAGYPAGVYKGRDWLYPSLAIFRAGANTMPMVEPVTLPGHSSQIITMGYDYSKTVFQVIDSLHQQRLDIETDGDARATNTQSAKATFVAIKIRSF